MKAVVTSATIDETDRTVDLTVEVYNSSNTLLGTYNNVYVSIDDLSNAQITTALKSLLETVRRSRADIPYTQAQVDAIAVGVTAMASD